MYNEKRLIEHHIDPRCSVIKENNSLIINLDHSPEAATYLLLIKLMCGIFILPLIFLLMKMIFEATILFMVFLLMHTPLIISYFFYKSRTFFIVINNTKKNIWYQKVAPSNKIFKSFEIGKVNSLVSRKNIELMFRYLMFTLKFKLINNKKKKIHWGKQEDIDKLGELISDFLEVPYTKS
ncbi:MAG: hypothetical protein ACFFBC_12705 [Promethearchaeota archaeon]